MTDRFAPTTATYKHAVPFRGINLAIAQTIADKVIPLVTAYPAVIIFTADVMSAGWTVTEQPPPLPMMARVETLAAEITAAISRHTA